MTNLTKLPTAHSPICKNINYVDLLRAEIVLEWQR